MFDSILNTPLAKQNECSKGIKKRAINLQLGDESIRSQTILSIKKR